MKMKSSCSSQRQPTQAHSRTSQIQQRKGSIMKHGRSTRLCSAMILALTAAAALMPRAQAQYWVGAPATLSTSFMGPIATYQGAVYAVVDAGNGTEVIEQWKPGDSAWQPFAAFTRINVLYTSGGYLYVGGQFTTAPGNIPAKNVAKYNFLQGTWSAVGDQSLPDKYVTAIAVTTYATYATNAGVYVGLLAGSDTANPDPDLLRMWN